MAETGKKVLVVDDDPDIVALLKTMLEAQGIVVVTAVDGQDALEKARSENPNLILLDIMLPKLDGYKVARMLKFDEKYLQIPIIMLTAKIQEKDKQMGFETGADEYVTKPFDITKLMERVVHYLNR